MYNHLWFKHIKVEGIPGSHIELFAKEVCELATSYNCTVETSFNGEYFFIRPSTDPQWMVDKYRNSYTPSEEKSKP